MNGWTWLEYGTADGMCQAVEAGRRSGCFPHVPGCGAVRRRHRLDESRLQKAVRQAAQRAGVAKPFGPQTLCHCFATHLRENRYDIRTVQGAPGSQHGQDDRDLYTRPQPGRPGCPESLGLGATALQKPSRTWARRGLTSSMLSGPCGPSVGNPAETNPMSMPILTTKLHVPPPSPAEDDWTPGRRRRTG